MTFLSFLRRRSRHHWLLLLTLILGVLLATTFLASGPILIDALLEFGLRRTVLNADLREDVFYLTLRESADQEAYLVNENQLQDFFQEHPNHLVTNLTPAGHVGYMYPWERGKISLDRRLTLGFYGSDIDELRQHISFVEGDFPQGDLSNPNEIPVLIGKFFAEALAIHVGDLLPVSISAQASQPELYLRIAGIITPQDFQDPYWLDHFNPFWPLEGTGEVIVYGVFIPRDSFSTMANALYPSVDVSYSWQANIQLDQVTFASIENMQTMLGTLENNLSIIHERIRVNTTLVELLVNFANEANMVRAPLYFLVGIVVLIAPVLSGNDV